LHPDYVCVSCRGPLEVAPSALSCPPCAAVYPFEEEIPDFRGGDSYDHFVPGQALSAEHRQGLEDEVPGAISRIERFYLPLLRGHFAAAESLLCKPRVLDCGCGNGLSVDLLNDAGLDAFGNDSSALRKWQWRERRYRRRLAAADGSKLPFRDSFFGAVICSGVLEHVGVRESNLGGYRAEPEPERDEKRRAFLGELIRVLAPGGKAWLDFPNGAFPIDFWHGTTARSGSRWHPTTEGFLPTFREIRGYLSEIDSRLTVRAIGPHGRLHFRRIRRYWYGRLFQLPARAGFRALSLPGMTALAGTALNPFLVLEIGKPSSG
jgi:SAM-dependent methyltransferase